MTKKKKSILSDQRFIVLLVIIALAAVFSVYHNPEYAGFLIL